MNSPLTKNAGEGSGRKLFASSEEIEEYLDSVEFLNRGQRICRWVVRGTNFEGTALFSDAYLKARRSVDRPSFLNVEDEKGFYKIFFILSLNLLHDRFRKARKERSLFSDLSRAAFTKPDPTVDLEEERLIGEFMDALKKLPDERRRAIMLRREGYTYRQIGEIVGCSHV